MTRRACMMKTKTGAPLFRNEEEAVGKESRMNFAENLRTLREKRGMTQEQLAERMEVSRQTVSKWESGVSLR